MKKNFVTLLIPAYNMADYISRLLDSILVQSYPLIDVIIINDGSSDNTSAVIEGYEDKFHERKIGLNLISQDNVGVAETINRGLKLVDGEYLAWPDSDDWYSSPYSIEKLVGALKESESDIGIVRCAYQRIKEETFECFTISHPSHTDKPSNIFDDAVKGKDNFWFEPGGWMVKVEYLDQFIPQREIYSSKYTYQNSQLLWPFLYYSKCVSIDEPLFCYLIRKKSYSRGFFSDYAKKKQQQLELGITFHSVIRNIAGMPEMKKIEYLNFIDEKRNFIMLRLAALYSCNKDVQYYYNICKSNKLYFPNDCYNKILYMASCIPYGLILINKMRKIIKK